MHDPVFSRSRQRGNTLGGVLIGLLIGGIIAAAVALYINFGPKPFLAPTTAPAREVPQSAPISQSGPVTLPGKPGDKPVEKPKLDFYRILPGGESASTPVTTAPANPAPEKLFLQAGAFQNPSDADNLKARLAMIGIEANAQRVELAGKGVFYRVRLGPFADAGAAESMRARLATEGIETSAVKSAQ